MSFILNYFNVKSENKSSKDSKASKEDLEEIQALKRQLVDVGYAPDEVNFMVKEIIKHKGKSLIDMSISEIERIKKALTSKLEIANKCLNVIKDQ